MKSATNIDTEIQKLVSQRSMLTEQLGDIQEKISMAASYKREGELYQSELGLQHQRLQSIELLPNDNICHCPLCNQQISDQTPQIKEILSSYQKLSAALEGSQQQVDRTENYVAELIAEESNVKLRFMLYIGKRMTLENFEISMYSEGKL